MEGFARPDLGDEEVDFVTISLPKLGGCRVRF
jgi:hypothetical protein